MSTYGTASVTGTVNGINPLFTLSTGTSEVYVNGVLVSSSTDYATSTGTTSGTATQTITFVPGSTPQSGDSLTVWLFNQ